MFIRGLKNFALKLSVFFKEEDSNASLESKIYHSFCYISIVASFLSFWINVYVDMKVVMWLSVSTFLFQSFCCYLSKVKGKLNLAIIISSLGFHAVLCINYFFNAGISGPTLLLTTLTIFFIIIVEKTRGAFFWLCFNFITTTALLTVEYLYEESIIIQYNNREDLFSDMYLTYLIIIVSIYNCIFLLRKKYQEQKDQITQKAISFEKLNSEKDKLFSLISHDLRIPLANVQQYLEMMATVELTLDEKKVIEKDLLHITRNAQDLLVNLLQWSKNQMEGIEVNLQSHYLLEEISTTLQNIKLLASKKEIVVNVNIDKDCIVYADVDMLNLIIRNLLHNAIKFTHLGGLVEIGTKIDINECIIYIKDNGVGIPLDQQKELFSLKTKSTFGTNREKGTGLGLMLCKEYVENQKGRIWFESEEGKGTVFYLSFRNKERLS